MGYRHSDFDRRRFVLGVAAASGDPGRGTVVEASGDARGWTIDAVAPRRRPAAVQSVGDLDVVALLDAAGPFTLRSTWQAVFPDATVEDFDAARRLDPAAFDPSGAWFLSFQCYAIRRPGGRATLVDLGIGSGTSLASPWAPVPGRLPDSLFDAGIEVEDVDVVVLTHLHEDHVGWSLLADATPMFPNARYVVQRDEILALADAPDEAMLDLVVEPLRRAGQLHEVEGWARLHGNRIHQGEPVIGAQGRVTLMPTPGHTPGHQSVLVDGGRHEVLITGDALVHAVQIVDPDVGYAFETDPAVARETRRALLGQATRRRALLACAHLNQPFVAV